MIRVPLHLQTPPSVVKLSPSTPAPRSSAPRRGARRSLFKTPAKDKTQLVVEDTASEANTLAQSEVGDGASSIEDKDDEKLPLMNKAAADDKDDTQKGKRAGSAKSAASAKKGRQ